ncbi:MAG: nicotinate (nicotinamide) nucleotide adenylyltransferase [Candidatus Midichloria sp.]|nr:MAG: nicotinate (nicotinamide) nucleotide adenylyltransferase [Candidatus Midichloria sp.]
MRNMQEKLLSMQDTGIRVGLLGGSFNPAHSGHLHVSLKAIELLNLECVIWLVSPQNPLKSNMWNSLDRRVLYARLIARNEKRIIVSDVEKSFPTTYTSETIKILKNTYPHVKFVWMMGADNMLQVHKWYNWKDIFESVFVAVFDREEYAEEVIASEASKCYNMIDIALEDFKKNNLDKRHWYFFRILKSPLSSTMLREVCQYKDFREHEKIIDMKDIDYIKDVVLNSLGRDQADDIKVCDLTNKVDLARYLVIASGRSNRHVTSMIENLMERLKNINVPSTTSGLEEATWVLLDAGDIIVNAFMPEYRAIYKLEELWG